MLTKDELKEIFKLLQPISQKVGKIEERMSDLEIKLDETKNGLEMSMLNLKAEVKEEFSLLKRQIKKIEDNQSLRGRVNSIEQKLHLGT